MKQNVEVIKLTADYITLFFFFNIACQIRKCNMIYYNSQQTCFTHFIQYKIDIPWTFILSNSWLP